MAKRDNPDIRYTFLSKADLQNIDKGDMIEPYWTCTKEMILHGLSTNSINDQYRIRIGTSRKYYNCVGGFNTATKTWKTFMVYDKKGCVQKGNLYTIMDFFEIDSTANYYDVKDIERKPELFLEIYKANDFVTLSESLSPQELADRTLNSAMQGFEWAKKVLAKPQNPIKIVCKREGITRPQLAKKIGVKLTLLENYISRETCSAWLIATLREYYNYI